MNDKADHVRSQPQTRNHTCHWPGCDRQVSPAMWGCKPHWFQLPKNLRSLIWATYEIGQEVSMTPSPEYLAAARRVQEWIEEHTDAARS
jgi:hypothetical protein